MCVVVCTAGIGGVIGGEADVGTGTWATTSGHGTLGIGCGVCQWTCPTSPEAIAVQPL